MCETVCGKASVLFACVHNAGRSQMAAAFLTYLSAGRVEVRSAGSVPAETVNPAVIEAMAEAGIDLSAEVPEVLTIEAVQASDVVITMGCGDACPVFPGKQYRDWKLDGSGWSGRRGGPLDPGAAMSSVNLFRTLGGSLGVAVFGSLFTRAARSHLPDTGGSDAGAPQKLSAGVKDAYLDAVAAGTGHIFLTGAILCALAFLAALFVIEVPLKAAGAPAPADTTGNTAVSTAT